MGVLAGKVSMATTQRGLNAVLRSLQVGGAGEGGGSVPCHAAGSLQVGGAGEGGGSVLCHAAGSQQVGGAGCPPPPLYPVLHPEPRTLYSLYLNPEPCPLYSLYLNPEP